MAESRLGGKWMRLEHHEIGRVISNVVHSYDRGAIDGVGYVDFVPWWGPERNPDKRNARAYTIKGFVTDARDGVTLNGRAFADRIGMSFPDMVRKYWDGVTTETKPSQPSTPSHALAPAADWYAVWSSLETDNHGTEEKNWLENTRGVFAPAHAIRDNVRIATASNASKLLECATPEQRKALQHNMPLAISPIRSVTTGDMTGLAYRATASAGARFRGLLKGSRKAGEDGAPAVYGQMPHRAVNEPCIVVAEGMADCITANALRDLVIGAIDAGQMGGALPRYLAEHTTVQVVLVNHDDEDGRKAIKRASEVLGSRCKPFNWEAFLCDLSQCGVPQDDEQLKDLADVVKKAKASGLPFAGIAAMFAAAVKGSLE